MNSPLIFIGHRAILVSNINYIDFLEALATNKDRRVKIYLINNTIIVVTDPVDITQLIKVFVPPIAASNYLSPIKLI